MMAVCLLAVTLYIAWQRLDGGDPFKRLYLAECLVVIAMLLIEAFTCLVDGHRAVWLRAVMQVANALLFLAPPLLTFSYFLLVKARTERREIDEVIAARHGLSWLPILVNAVLALLSPALGWLFFYDGQGVYHRGPLFGLSVGIAYLYLFLALGLMLRRRNRLLKSELRLLALCCLMPVFGGSLQALIYGPLLMWPSAACTMVLMYLYHRERIPEMDSLTGACTRGAFERYMARLLENDDREPFGIVYLDLNDLKAINDAHGHALGDEAIKEFVALLRALLREGDMVARLGGDEFVILTNTRMPAELQAFVQRIRAALRAFNGRAGKPYTLSCSIGADLFMRSAGGDVQSILRQVDRLMYEDKRSKYANGFDG